MRLIILSISNYKEKDGIVTALGENESISFLARGIFDPKNKNAALNNPLCMIDAELVYKNSKYPNLESYALVSSPFLLKLDFKRITAMQVLLEATLKLVIEEERFYLYEPLKEALVALKSGIDPNSVVLIYLGKVLKVNGYTFSINECNNCGSKKDIVAFSFFDGGFICKDCLDETIKCDLNSHQMLLMREIFGNQDYKNLKELDEEDTAVILSKFFEFISHSFDVNMKSFDLFLK